MSDSNKTISLFRKAFLGFAALVGLDLRLRTARFNIKAERILNGGGQLQSRKFRRSRCWRGRNMGHGHEPSPLRQVRNATAFARGLAGINPRVLEKLRAINLAKRNRVWKDPRFQSISKALAYAA